MGWRKSGGNNGPGCSKKPMRKIPQRFVRGLAQARSVTDRGVDQQAQRNLWNGESRRYEFIDDRHRAEKRLPQLPYNERSPIG